MASLLCKSIGASVANDGPHETVTLRVKQPDLADSRSQLVRGRRIEQAHLVQAQQRCGLAKLGGLPHTGQETLLRQAVKDRARCIEKMREC